MRAQTLPFLPHSGLFFPKITKPFSQRVLLVVRLEEIPVPVPVIWAAWRGHKISDKDVCKELIRSRDRGAVAALQDVEVLVKRERTLDLESEIRREMFELTYSRYP